MALEQLFPGTEISSRLYFCTQRGGFRRLDFPLNESGRQAAISVLSLIDGSIEAGFLPAAPREGACETCDYRSICGPYEELRVARKDRGPIRDLTRLRAMP
jgi:CRISPR/Cas system-associated exonuclease Cas4 (RecB family)